MLLYVPTDSQYICHLLLTSRSTHHCQRLWASSIRRVPA